MRTDWDKWFKQATEHMDAQLGRKDLIKSDSFEREAWRAWASHYDYEQFCSEYVREKRPFLYEP